MPTDNMAIKIHEGRLPENDTEIAVSVRINDKYKLNYKVGDTIKVTVIRDGKPKDLNVTLASSKQTT